MTTFNGQVLIVGAGLAGLFTALKLAPLPVVVVSADKLGEGASSVWAQGGVAAAVGPDDSASEHAQDTVRAGAGLVDEDIARLITQEGGAAILDLVAFGVPFDRDAKDALVLSREAAHSKKRVVRVTGDRAGFAIMQALIHAARKTPSITFLEGYSAEALIKTGEAVTGLELTRADDAGGLFTLDGARAVVLASGGIGGLYALSTNPPHALGQAIAMSAKAGAVIEDAEFVQFHPTAIDVGINPAPLATEALRGEGATLINSAGERFMLNLDPAGELAPRDIVARGVFDEVRSGRGAFLDCREAVGARMATAFPTVTAACMKAGLDPATKPIPIAPAEHYHMGGVRTDRDGRTNVAGLYVVGEAACTGLHGANRLASNSLLEAVVMGARAAASLAASAKIVNIQAKRLTLERSKARHLPDFARRATALKLIQATLSDHLGVVREDAGLREAISVLSALEADADGDQVIENMALTAHFIAEAALRRRESRGSHFRSDYPNLGEPARHSMITLQGLRLRSGGAAAAMAPPAATA